MLQVPVWLAAGGSGSCAEITVHLYVFHCSSKPLFSLLSSPLTDAVAAAGARNSSSAGSGSRSLLSAAQRPTPCYSAGAGAGRSPAKRFLRLDGRPASEFDGVSAKLDNPLDDVAIGLFVAENVPQSELGDHDDLVILELVVELAQRNQDGV